MSEILYVRHGRLHYFVREVLKRSRLPQAHASKVGDALVSADLAGFEGEGVRRLPYFANRISTGLINPSADVRVAHQEEATATIDGDNAMGHVVASRSMETAIGIAKTFGVSAVSARNSNDFGMASYYARYALEEQMVGIVISNSTPAMVPTYGASALVGSNPIAIAIPAAEGAPPFVLDIATTATSRHHLEEAARRGQPIPPGLALDASGEPTTDPKVALERLGLLPLGGQPETGSHKGFGLALAFEILSGILSGATTGPVTAAATDNRRDVAALGHLVIAIRLRAFGPWIKFRNAIKQMMDALKGAKAKGAPQIYYPGEAEFEIEQERRASGIPLDPQTAAELEGLSRRLDIHDAWEHLVEGRK